MNSSTDKSWFRTIHSSKRNGISHHDHALRSQQCCTRLAEAVKMLPQKQAIISGYAPVKSELNIMPALTLLARHHIIALPAVTAGHKLLAFYPWKPGDLLHKGSHGIDMPNTHAPAVTPDIVILPLLAFDRQGYRLGYGGGYYDATLHHLRAANPKLMAIGVAFSIQEEIALPQEAHDEIMNMVVTEKEVIVGSGSRA